MGAYPTTPRATFLEWCQAHSGVFSTNASQIGLSAPQASAFAAAATAAAAALLAQEQARQAALVATQVAEEAFGALRSSAGDTVRLIRAFAESQSTPSLVYNIAQISPPSPPAPAPPPAQPTDLTVTLDASGGNLTLRWKAANPPGTSGTAYIIRRKVQGESAFSFLGVSGRKEFVDDTLIAGADSVQYTVQGQRADSSGPLSPIFTVNFGRVPGGGLAASVVREGIHAPAGGARESSHVLASTVDGQAVRKVLPNGSGRAGRANSRV